MARTPPPKPSRTRTPCGDCGTRSAISPRKPPRPPARTWSRKASARPTRRTKHTQQTGTGTRKKTRTWYTTKHYQDCKKVRSGTETYTRTVRPQQWCVRLDDVDGDTSQDDLWYQVTHATYDEALAMAEHTRIEFTPAGTGC